MHISDGVLSPAVLVGGAALAVFGTAVGLKKLDYDRLPQAAIMAAGFFVASLVHVPIGPAKAHLVLNGLLGLLLGWGAFPTILVGLTLQAVVFQYGGLTTLGVNTLVMAGPAVLVYLFCRRGVQARRPGLAAAAAFVAGAGSVLVSGLLVAGALTLSGDQFFNLAWAVVLAHFPVMLVEGLLTMAIISFLRRVRPEILETRL